MRISTLSKFVLVAAVAMIIIPSTPAQAQRYRGTSNSYVGTVGDSNVRRNTALTHRFYDMNLTGGGGLFAGSESYSYGSGYRPFIFALPAFTDVENEFINASYDQYLAHAVHAYDGGTLERYKSMFLAQNEFTMATGYPLFYYYADSDLRTKYDVYSAYGDLGFAYYFPDEEVPDFAAYILEAFDTAHKIDFRAGGGYLPPIPKDKPEPPVVDPPDPFPPFPVPDSLATEGINEDAALANEITGGGEVNVDETGAVTLEGNEIVGSASASQSESSAPSVAVVPEPATLGLLTLGTGMMLARRRR